MSNIRYDIFAKSYDFIKNLSKNEKKFIKP